MRLMHHHQEHHQGHNARLRLPAASWQAMHASGSHNQEPSEPPTGTAQSEGSRHTAAMTGCRLPLWLSLLADTGWCRHGLRRMRGWQCAAHLIGEGEPHADAAIGGLQLAGKRRIEAGRLVQELHKRRGGLRRHAVVKWDAMRCSAAQAALSWQCGGPSLCMSGRMRQQGNILYYAYHAMGPISSHIFIFPFLQG